MKLLCLHDIYFEIVWFMCNSSSLMVSNCKVNGRKRIFFLGHGRTAGVFKLDPVYLENDPSVLLLIHFSVENSFFSVNILFGN